MKFVTALIKEETFTFTPEGEEEEVHILSGQLRRWLLEKAMDRVILLTFPDNQTEEELIQQHGLEAPRMASMTEEEAKEPVIVGIWPEGKHVLIDGGHRRWFWHKRGINAIKGWAVPFDIWNVFRLEPSEYLSLKHHRDGALLPQRRK